MRSRKIAMVCVSMLGAAALWGGESLAGPRTSAGSQMGARRGCDGLVNMKHPEAKGAARKAEFGKCMSDPEGYNR